MYSCRCCGLKHVYPDTGKALTDLSRCDKFRNMDLDGSLNDFREIPNAYMPVETIREINVMLSLSLGRHSGNVQ